MFAQILWISIILQCHVCIALSIQVKLAEVHEGSYFRPIDLGSQIENQWSLLLATQGPRPLTNYLETRSRRMIMPMTATFEPHSQRSGVSLTAHQVSDIFRSVKTLLVTLGANRAFLINSVVWVAHLVERPSVIVAHGIAVGEPGSRPLTLIPHEVSREDGDNTLVPQDLIPTLMSCQTDLRNRYPDLSRMPHQYQYRRPILGHQSWSARISIRVLPHDQQRLGKHDLLVKTAKGAVAATAGWSRRSTWVPSRPDRSLAGIASDIEHQARDSENPSLHITEYMKVAIFELTVVRTRVGLDQRVNDTQAVSNPLVMMNETADTHIE